MSFRKGVLLVVALLTATLPVLIDAPPTSARSIAVGVSAQAVSIIDPTLSGALTVRFVPGNPHDDHPGPSQVGVPVLLKRVASVDLTTHDGWLEAAAMGRREILRLNDEHFSDHRTSTSDSHGSATFAGLPLGLWVVESPRDADRRFDSFVIALPLADSTGTHWRYEYTVYPKSRDIGGSTPGIPLDPPFIPTTTPPAPTPPASTFSQSPVPDPDEGAHPDGGEGTDSRGDLASTGAAVSGILLLGAALTTAGFILLRRKRPRVVSPKRPQTDVL